MSTRRDANDAGGHRRWPVSASLLACLVGAAIVAGCGGSGGSAASGGDIKVGYFAPESGPEAADGASNLAGTKIAIDRINAHGGVDGRKLTLVNYDDASDPKQAVVIATKLVTRDHVDVAISGSYSDQTLAAAPIFQRYKVPMIAGYAVNPGIAKTGSYIFQNGFNGQVEGAAMAYQLVKKMGATRVAEMRIDNDFGQAVDQGFQQEAKKLGADVVAVASNDFGEKDFGPAIRSALSHKPDGYFLNEYAPEATQFMRAWHSLGVKMPLVASEGVNAQQEFFDPVGTAADGLVFPGGFAPGSSDPEVKAFVAKYKQDTGRVPDSVGAVGADVVSILAGAVRNGTSGEQIRAGIAATRNFKGITETVERFTPGRVAVRPVTLGIVRNGQEQPYGQIAVPSILAMNP